MRPSPANASATIFFTAASSPVSALRCSTLMLLLTRAISAAVFSSAALSRAVMATFTPSRASSSAIALPMPRLPPVTIAVLPLSSRSMGSLPAFPCCGFTASLESRRASCQSLIHQAR